MKTLKTLVLAIGVAAVALSLSNCKKDGKHTVKGRVVHSCSDTRPLKGIEVFLYNDHKSMSNTCNSGEIARTTTDENGMFALTYDKSCGSGIISLNYAGIGQRAIVDGMEANKDYELGDIYNFDNGFYIARIHTSKPYTNKDTLFFAVKQVLLKDSAEKTITGPFTDGQIVDTMTITVARLEGYRANSTNAYVTWMLRNDTLKAGSIGGQAFHVEPCKLYNEFTIDLDK